MKVFFDESGDDPREKAYVLAGWVADDETWEHFSRRWNDVLASHGIAYFKHNDAKALKNEFAGRTDAERDQVLAELVRVVCDHDVTGIVVTFSHKLFKALLEGSTIPRAQLKKMAYGGYTSPYYFCFHLGISQLLRYLVEELNVTSQVDFIFDDRTDALAACIKLYNTIRGTMPRELLAIAGSAAHGNDRSTPPLQAADLLAGQITANIRAGSPEATLKALIGCRKILKCHIEPQDLSRFKATLQYMNTVWKKINDM